MGVDTQLAPPQLEHLQLAVKASVPKANQCLIMAQAQECAIWDMQLRGVELQPQYWQRLCDRR